MVDANRQKTPLTPALSPEYEGEGVSNLTLIIPMAGRGDRFVRAGVSTPKPLIDVLGKPMYAWAVESLPLDHALQLIFLCLKEHLEHTPLRADIEQRFAQQHPTIIAIDQVTQGQACTVLLAREHIRATEPLVIFNADTYCRPSTQLTSPPQGVLGMLGVFQAAGDRWSFAKTNADGRVIETAEKKRISDWASTGLYHFTRGDDFVRYAEQMIRREQRVNGEFYIAPVYNQMIADGLDIRIDVASEAAALGTPEDLTAFLKSRL